MTSVSRQTDIPDVEQYELKKVAEKSVIISLTLGLFISPLAYVYLGKWKYAVINFFTLNYLLIGFLAVPVHTYMQISDARGQLNQAGINWN